MFMHLADCLNLFPAFLHGIVTKYQSPDLVGIFSNAPRKIQIPLGKKVQDCAPTDIFIAQQIIVRILTAISFFKFPKLPSKVTVNVPVLVKEHNQQGGNDQGNPVTTLLN